MKTRIASILLIFSQILAGVSHAFASSVNGAGFSESATPTCSVQRGVPDGFPWKTVDSLVSLGQPRSALTIVDKIYEEARSGRNTPEFIKAVLYRIRIHSEFRENFLNQTIRDLRDEIKKSAEPATSLLHSILAEVYWRYYQNNSYRFGDRSRITNPDPDSLATWDLNTITEAITNEYLLSTLNENILTKIPIASFSAILDTTGGIGSEIRSRKVKKSADPAETCPTLYDFVAQRALDFFTSNQGPVNQPAVQFRIDQPAFFSPSAKFISINDGPSGMHSRFLPYSSISTIQLAFRIYQSLVAFHLQDKNPAALVSIELDRLKFMLEKAIMPTKDSLYVEALKELGQRMTGSPVTTSVSFALANYLNEQGLQYIPTESVKHKWDCRDARQICEAAIRLFPDSDGAKNCQTLLNTILQQQLQVITETAVSPAKASLARVEIRNAGEIFFRIVQADPMLFLVRQDRSEQKDLLKYLNSLPVIKSWSQSVPTDGDLQKHAAAVAIPPVPAGFYILLGSTGRSFTNKEDVYAYAPFWSTELSYVSKRNVDGSIDWFVLNRETGVPVKNVKAEAWERRYDYKSRDYTTARVDEFVTDELGYFRLPATESQNRAAGYFLKFFFKDDQLISENIYRYPVPSNQERSYLQTMFYTDRAIYRPGQTVYFKGIVIEKTGNLSEIRSGKSTKVTFTDANGQKISEATFITSNFGSFNSSFVIPTGRMPGTMTIRNESGSISFSVEEYKRPTFEVTFNPLEGNYRLDEPLAAIGKATSYAGNPIVNGYVNFRISRTERYPFRDLGWFWPVNPGPEAEIANGVTKTDSAGNFTIQFVALADPAVEKQNNPVFDFTITADVTDLNGETQSIQHVVSAGYISLLIDHNLKDKVNILTDSAIMIKTTNLNGVTTPSRVTVILTRLRQPDRVFRPRQWSRPDLEIMTAGSFHEQFPYDIYSNEDDPSTWPVEKTIVERNIDTKTDSVIQLFEQAAVGGGSGSRLLTSGAYLLVLKSTDPFGSVAERRSVFTAFRTDSREVPEQTMNWFIPLKTSGEPGETAQFMIGSKEDNVNVIYEIRLKDTLVSREMLKINDRAVIIDIPIREQYRGNVSVNFMFVKHNRVFQNSQLVTVPFTNKKLDIRFATFRKRPDPGTGEEWKIMITGPAGKPAHAEFLASMYDASLDLFRANRWSFNLFPTYNGLYPWDVNNAFRLSPGQSFGGKARADVMIMNPELQLNWFGLSYFGQYRNRMYRSGKGYYATPMVGGIKTTAMQDDQVALAESQEADPGSSAGSAESAAADAEEAPVAAKAETPVQVRKNFNETAFFYPSLVTDSTGSVMIRFTVPESLTRWKFSGLAHTGSLEYGLTEQEVVTRKDLMVFPNAPRFVRQGDTVVFSTKVVNLAGKDLEVDVNIDLTDPITLKTLNQIILAGVGNPAPGNLTPQVTDHGSNGKGEAAGSLAVRRLSLPANGSKQVSWTLAIPAGANISLLQFRITAQSQGFSDGEERLIPVLTNRMLVTESLPLPIRGKSTVSYTLNKLLQSGADASGSLKNYRLTLEFATNPAWYTIQALPSLNDKQFESADAIFNAFYSNSIAYHIANSNPAIRAVFESWKSITPDALLSNLEKNEELKSAVLSETPWVMDARNESEQKRELGRYFDLNNAEQNLRTNLAKLQELQLPSGGWTWFNGMPGNRWVTQNIITGLGRLGHLGITAIRRDPGIWNMVSNGIKYLDGELVRDYERLKQYENIRLDDDHLSATQIQYLYARSYFLNDKGVEIAGQDPKFREAFGYYQGQAMKYWIKNDRYLQGMMALALFRLDQKETAGLILKSLREKSLQSDEMGMYWAAATGPGWYRWYEAPVETQAMMIEAFDEVLQEEKTVEELKIWLLKQKQTRLWRSDRATVEACYALLLRGTDLLSTTQGELNEPMGTTITLGKLKINPDKLADVVKEAGTGFFKMSWQGDAITPSMGSVKVSKTTGGVAWGALYWQYFEDLDKITPAQTPLNIEKKLYLERNTAAGPVLEEVLERQSLHVGDKIVVRVVLRVDRDLEFVHMKDLRASALEPVYLAKSEGAGNAAGTFSMADRDQEMLSGYRYQEGLGYYRSTTDLATNFFFDYLPKGSYVFEYGLRINAAGEYSNGITTVQCLYAPEFAAHSEGIRITVK